MTDPRRRSPLADREPIADEAGSYRLAEVPLLGKLILRADRTAGTKAVKSVLGIGLPSASRSAQGDDVTLLWLGPDEWMLVTAPDAEKELAAKLADAFGSKPHQIASVGDYYTTIAISGANAREALAKLTMLDLHERAFKPGEVRGSVFAKATGLLHLADGDPPRFNLYVRASMADYLWCLLAVSGREFGMPQQQPRGGERLVI